MPTDVSAFKDAYKTAIGANFPETVKITFGNQETELRKVSYDLRYGTNPHQPFAAYFPIGSPLCIGNLELLKGGKAGLSLTNLQDMSQALNVLKYFSKPACVAMKHLNPCGFKVTTNDETTAELYRLSRMCDERSHFGAVVGFNSFVDKQTAEEIMQSFVECVVAPHYSNEALEILKRNEGTRKLNNSIRVAKYDYDAFKNLPKFRRDNLSNGLWNIRTLADGTMTFEVPYLTQIEITGDFITDPMVQDSNGAHIAETIPTQQQLQDGLTAWYLNINVRSNGIVFVKNGQALSVGTGQQERIGAVEQAIQKARREKHSLEGSVMSSDAFFPSRDCIDAVAAEGVKAVVWPAGSIKDAEIIDAANEYGIALLATLERCFAHF